MSNTPDAILRQWFTKVWNEGDEATIDALMAADAVIHGLPSPDGQPLRGAAAFKPFYQTFRGALSDIRIDIEHIMCEGDMAMAHCRVSATHTGPTFGFTATDRSVEFEGFTLARVVGGQIVEGWNSYDFLGMYAQLGATLQLPA